MRTTRRTAAAIALALPLVAPALPAVASSPVQQQENGPYAAAWFAGPETTDLIPGNVAGGSILFRGDAASGYLDTYDCDEGETPWGGDESDENLCEVAGSYYVVGAGMAVGGGKGATSTRTYSGIVELEDAWMEDGDASLSDVPVNLALTPTGAPSRSTSSYTNRDPETGYVYRIREVERTSPATVVGTFGGVDVGAFGGGEVGSYSVLSTMRVTESE